MSDADGVQGGGPLTAGEDAHLRAARVAQRLWGAGLACEIVNLVPAPTAVLRRDRIIVVLALALPTGLAWSYLLWLSADMSSMAAREDMNVRRYHFLRHMADLLNAASEMSLLCQGLHRAVTL